MTHNASDNSSAPVPEQSKINQKSKISFPYLVHVYTASGVVFAFLAAAEIAAAPPDAPDPRWVFLWLVIAVVIDATDGPLARRWDVKRNAPRIDGRTIDDVLDYLTFTFVPLMLVWRMGWLGGTGWAAGVLVAAAMAASLLGFANTGAKQEEAGFFLGFPSYWNIYAYYAGLWYALAGPIPGAVMIVVLTILTLAPVRFIYPNLAPRPWKIPLLLGAAAWLALLLAMLPWYPDVPAWVMWVSLVYPVFYWGLSVYLDVKDRRRHSPRHAGG